MMTPSNKKKIFNLVTVLFSLTPIKIWRNRSKKHNFADGNNLKHLM